MQISLCTLGTYTHKEVMRRHWTEKEDSVLVVGTRVPKLGWSFRLVPNWSVNLQYLIFSSGQRISGSVLEEKSGLNIIACTTPSLCWNLSVTSGKFSILPWSIFSTFPWLHFVFKLIKKAEKRRHRKKLARCNMYVCVCVYIYIHIYIYIYIHIYI